MSRPDDPLVNKSDDSLASRIKDSIVNRFEDSIVKRAVDSVVERIEGLRGVENLTDTGVPTDIEDLMALDRSARYELLGLLLAVIGLALAGGGPGLLAGVVLGIVWYLLPGAYAFTVGWIAIVAIVGDGGVSIGAALCVLGLVVVLLSPVGTLPRLQTVLTGTGLAAVGLLVVTRLAYAISGTLWIAALVLVVLFGLSTYGLYRYDLLTTGSLEVHS